MSKMSGQGADRFAKLRRRQQSGPVYYRTPPTTASLQTKSSDLAPVFDYYGSLMVCWLVSLLAVLGFTGGKLIPALLVAAVLTWLFSRWRQTADSRAASRSFFLQGSSLCRDNLLRIIAEGRFFALLSELLPHFSYQEISYLGQRPAGVELAMAARHGKAVLIAFFTSADEKAIVGKETADSLREVMSEFAPAAITFFTAAPLSLAAIRRLSRGKGKFPITVYDQERLVALCRAAGHPAYPTDASIRTGQKTESLKRTGATKEMTITQGIAAAKRKMNTHVLTAGLLLLLALWLPAGIGIRVIYLGFAAYNLGQVFFNLAAWRRDIFRQNELLAQGREHPVK